jgi:hypothetical protein
VIVKYLSVPGSNAPVSGSRPNQFSSMICRIPEPSPFLASARAFARSPQRNFA